MKSPIDWNQAQCAWIDAQPVLDRMFLPFELLLSRAIVASDARRVLDVGCGTGATTLAAARVLGAGGEAVGVDVSEPMIAVARARAKQESLATRFIADDAATHAFEAATFDRLISRFGVMFFEDPIAAFRNLRSAVRPGGELDVIAWRSLEENPFMTTAERAAASLLPTLAPRDPNAPGQFAFAHEAKVRHILESSGWSEVVLHRIDIECVLPEAELTRYGSRMGLVGRALESADENTRREVSRVVREAFQAYVRGTEAKFIAACFRIRAKA